MEIVLASDGVEGLGELQAAPFDILITDLNMPRMDGLTLLRNARLLHPNLLTIIVTGYGSLESAIDGIRLGAYDYLQKPFKMEEMMVTARNAIEKIKILRERARLLREIEVLHQKLRLAEVVKNLREKESNGSGSEEAMEKAMFLPSRRTLPLWLLDPPQDNRLSGALTALESIKELRRDGTISDPEFKRLKQLILDKVEAGKS